MEGLLLALLLVLASMSVALADSALTRFQVQVNSNRHVQFLSYIVGVKPGVDLLMELQATEYAMTRPTLGSLLTRCKLVFDLQGVRVYKASLALEEVSAIATMSEVSDPSARCPLADLSMTDGPSSLRAYKRISCSMPEQTWSRYLGVPNGRCRSELHGDLRA
jgi:hypothetical protein